ncbi:MAG: hypothetical protein BWY51_00054 [Parcubacteria group bacterium ADurb.Bin316]|nr:MAG: hypothetical protein BWY51_00054 [Parcubacteria group bacterium ADurb.Bin316]
MKKTAIILLIIFLLIVLATIYIVWFIFKDLLLLVK